MPALPKPRCRSGLRRFFYCAAAAGLATARPHPARADPETAGHAHGVSASSELGHGHTSPHDVHPHLTHPLVTESPLPENQLRFDVGYARASDGPGESEPLFVEASIEVALTSQIGLELAVPYVWTDIGGGSGSDGIGNAEVAVKFADYRFGGSGLLLGAGLEVELPTSDDQAGTGDDRQVGLEPYVGFGYRRDRVETIGLLRFGVPVNERAADAAEVDLELGLDVSLLYHFTPRVAGLIEFNGAAVVAGASDDTVLAINPGLSFDPVGDGQMRVGVGFGVPVTDDAGFDYEARTMVVLHF